MLLYGPDKTALRQAFVKNLQQAVVSLWGLTGGAPRHWNAQLSHANFARRVV